MRTETETEKKKGCETEKMDKHVQELTEVQVKIHTHRDRKDIDTQLR